jgi:hypothetical protein
MEKVEEKHFLKCEKCGQLVDMRDLSNVFEHEHDESIPDLKGKKFIAKRKDEDIAWYDGKQISIN